MPVRKNNFNPERVRIVTEFRQRHPEAGAPAIADATGLPESSISRILRMLRAAGETPESPLQPKDRRDPIPEERGIRYDADANLIVDVAENPRTVDQLLDACRIDRKRWRVARVIANKWEVGAKGEDLKVRVTPLYQIKVYLEPMPGLKEADAIREAIDYVKAQKAVPAKVDKVLSAKLAAEDPSLLVVSICDTHVGKLAHLPEVGSNYDIKIATALHLAAVNNLVTRAAVYPIRRIVYVVGNDLLNSDNPQGTTTAGTPQDNDGRWQKAFRAAIDLTIKSIEILRARATEGVDVIVCAGNHDTVSGFHLGCVIEAAYAHAKDVRVDNSPNPRKYFRFGTNLLGFTHGHAEKHNDLPMTMATERPRDFADTTYRCFMLGHLHTSRETRYHARNELGVVRVHVLPSLTASDRWHHESGYIGNQRASEAWIFAEKTGYAGHLSWTAPKEAYK